MMALWRLLLANPKWVRDAVLAIAQAIASGQSDRAKRLAYEAAWQRHIDIVAELAAKQKP